MLRHGNAAAQQLQIRQEHKSIAKRPAAVSLICMFCSRVLLRPLFERRAGSFAVRLQTSLPGLAD